MMVRLLLAFAVLLGASAPARADPVSISTLVALVVEAAGITGTAAAITTAVVSAIVTTAIGIGISLIFAPRPKTPTPESGSITVQQPLPFIIFGYGTACFAGALVFKEANAPFLGVVAVLNGHPISAFRGMYLNNDLVATPIIAGKLNGAVPTGADFRYNAGAVLIDSRLGAVPETAHSLIIANFSDVWTTAFRGDGCASIAMLCQHSASNYFQMLFPYGQPIPRPIIDQYKCFDWRDVTQNVADPTTWKFTTNPVICIAHYQCHSAYGPRRVFNNAILPILAKWTGEANICDELVPLRSGGTEKRFELGGWITTESARVTALQTMLTACDGWFCERGDGTLDFTVGKYRAPTVFLTDDDIIGFHFDRGVSSDEKINQATAKFTSPAANYTTAETVPMVDYVDQAARGGPARAAQLDLQWVQSLGQASRLLKREFLKQQETHRGSLQFRLTGLNACYERWVGINSNSLPFLNGKVIETRKPVISLMVLSAEVAFTLSGPQIDTYDATVDESPSTIIPVRAASGSPPVPGTLSVVVEQSTDANGTSSIFLAVSWDMPQKNGADWYLSYVLQYRLHDIGGGIPGPWTQITVSSFTPAAGRINVATGNVPVGAILDVQVYVSTSIAIATSIVIVSTALTAAAPASPGSITATGGVGSASLSCANPSSANLSYVRFFRAAHGGSFGSSVAIGSNISAAPGGTSTYTDTTAAGTYDWFVVAYNSTGVGSGPTGPASATIT